MKRSRAQALVVGHETAEVHMLALGREAAVVRMLAVVRETALVHVPAAAVLWCWHPQRISLLLLQLVLL